MPAPPITFYVVLPPQSPDCSPPLRPISRLVNETEEAVKARLATTTYEVLSRFAKRANAEGLRSQLAAFGIESFIVSDQDVRGQLIIWASSANRGAGGMALKDFNDKPVYCPFEDIIGVAVLDVPLENGSRTQLIDLHRRSTNITPRLDANLFDFAKVLASETSGLPEFLADLESRTKLAVNRSFLANSQKLVANSADFASRPAHFAPPAARLASPYDKAALGAADLYSFVLQMRLKATV